MHFRTLGLFLLLTSGIAFAAPSRGPAVEDFVGIDVEQAGTPQDETLYNLEQDLDKIETARKEGPVDVAAPRKVAPAPAAPWSTSTIFGVLFILGLPLVSWLMVLNHLRKKAGEESASNIQVLENYRKSRELAKDQKKSDDVKKAS